MASTELRAAAQQALEALEDMLGWQSLAPQTIQEAAKGRAAALRAALAEPVQCADNDSPWLICKPCAAEGVCKKAEPQEPDSPERRCGGPGCDGTCCQPVQEPQGCDHCNHPLYAATKCRVCGRVTEPTTEDSSAVGPVQEPVAWRTFDGEGGYDYRTYEDNEDYAAEWAKRNPRHVGWVEPLFTAPPQRKPLTEEEISEIASRLEQQGNTMRQFARAVERAHGIGGEG